MSSEKPVSHFLELARGMVPPMHPAGRPFVAGAAIATLLVRLRFKRLGVVLGLVTAWVAWFFREPKRVTPTRPNIAVAPADGTVSHVVDAVPPAELGLGSQPMTRVSVFLSVFDVHVQRVPADGEVVQVSYHPGKFLSADLDKASEENERNTVCEVAEGEKVAAGQTYGLIRFGSRVDLYVPRGSRVLVEAGQRTIGGETVLAELPEA
jgi:phosphatidylserine decarboxylase